MLVKTSELEGAALDWAVAKCEGKRIFIIPCIDSPNMVVGKNNPQYQPTDLTHFDLVLTEHWKFGWNLGEFDGWEDGISLIKNLFRPSTNWAQGGPIIDSNPKMQFWYWGGQSREEMQCACLPVKEALYTRFTTYFGKTKLISAMRCYVASKLGNEINIPEELL